MTSAATTYSTWASWYEAMIRWVGPATRVMANTSVNVTQRRDEDGSLIR